MKKKLLIALLFIPFLFASCETDNNYGYPSKITFQKEGGIILCSGTSRCYGIDIDNYNGNGAGSGADSDSVRVTYDWLTIKYKRSTNTQLEMIATPNPSRKKHKLYPLAELI